MRSLLRSVPLLALAACGGGIANPDGSGGDGSTLDAPSADGSTPDARASDASSPPRDGAANDGSTAGDVTTPPNDSGTRTSLPFRRGVNPGYYGPGIDRRESAQLSQRAGADSLRTTLPEHYLAMWGDTIEVDDWAYYTTLGIDQHVIFLIGPSADHSSAPAGTPDWQLDHYAPRNLYEPIFLSDGSVNPQNYWAAYVERVARNYGDHLDVYEVWNEPDQVLGNWQVTEQWATRAPMASELVWWNDTIYAYVRALRITHEVVHRIDPTARVTVGGVGYPNFLRAVLRYTDEPTAGAVTADYPNTGAAYLDVLSYHYYPVFAPGSSDVGVDGFLAARDAMRAALDEAHVAPMDFAVTESGAPRYALGTSPGGLQYSAAYLLKMMTLADFEGFARVDWFAQGDGAAQGASSDPFAYMGLYFDYSSAQMPSDVNIAPQGEAYAWLGNWLANTTPDAPALAALSLPPSARGASFKRPDGGERYVLWARTGSDENASATIALPATGAVRVRTWAPGASEQMQTVSPSNGAVSLQLTGMPTVVDVP